MELFYRSYGTGEPVIILHGMLGCADNWHGPARSLADGRRVIVPDLRNHGRSPHHDSMTYSDLAGDILEMMDAVGIETAALAGHSLGGRVAMTVADACPERVTRLACIDIGPGDYPLRHVPFLKIMADLELGRFHDRRDVDKALLAQVPDPALRQFVLKNLRRTADDGFCWKVNLPVIRAAYAELMKALALQRRFSNPVLLLRGGRSEYVDDGQQELFRRYYPRARVETLPAAGHWIHADEPVEFLRTLKTFLESPANGA